MSAFNSLPLFPLALFLITATLLQLWLLYRYRYWHRRKVPFLQPTMFLGNLKPLLLLRTSFGDYFHSLYAEPSLKSAPFFGFFILHTPALLIRDPQLIEQLLIKEFNSFPNRFEAAELQSDPMGALTLPLAKYAIWRKSRREISKLFTTGHIKKKMYPKLVTIAEQLEGYITRKLIQKYAHSTADASGAIVIEVKEMCALYTTDVTAELLYSVDTGGLRNDGCEMRAQCKQLFRPSLRKIIDFFVIFFLPRAVRALNSKLFTRQYSNYLRRLVKEHIKKEGNYDRDSGDLIDLLLKMQQTLADTPLNIWLRHPDFIAAQVGIFLLAGFETSSSLIAFILFELAKQPKIQQKLKTELAAYASTESCNVSYKKVLNMPYLNMAVAEGLRLYPTAPFINRECLPHSQQQTLWYDKETKYLIIPKDVPAYVSILGIHRDSKYWPNPQFFDPERFAPENLPSIKPMTYIPFGAGPHGCVGSRLGILQVKLGLIYILRKYRVEVCERTVNEIRFDPKRFMLEAEGELYLKFVKDELC
ncbi:probable cytochrome P450 6t3 [Rhagoletis pomonella]|uniref:probable cytochrome P450 6t3 n=1 Tax=Rhagoletis pomonella TaxID=28610 RepID=UPI001780A0FC|nr:probable cytochrome P450 6t3 [Rhagoletis pomonella]